MGAMTGPLAFDTGTFLPAEQLSIPVFDTGFILGVTISEQLRTFGGKLFQLERHLSRLAKSLHIIGVDPGMSPKQIGDAATELVQHNHALLKPGDDLGCAILVSPGASTVLAPEHENRPRVRIYTHPLPFASWARTYDEGVALAIPQIRQTPVNCWPPELKHRSRMHYYLADRQAKQIDPSARAVILDQEGWVLEATTANLLIYHEAEGIISPPLESILLGVSLSVIDDLLKRMPFGTLRYRRISAAELETATEVMLCSTSPCVWPVTRLNGKPIGRSGTHSVAHKLLSAWSELVGFNISSQAAAFANRPSAIR